MSALGQILSPDFRVQQLEFQKISAELLGNGRQVPPGLRDLHRDRLGLQRLVQVTRCQAEVLFRL